MSFWKTQPIKKEKYIENSKQLINIEHLVIKDNIAKGMEIVFNILESAEDDFSNFLPGEKEPEKMDIRVLEAMDNTILLADEDILGFASNI